MELTGEERAVLNKPDLSVEWQVRVKQGEYLEGTRSAILAGIGDSDGRFANID